MSTSNSPSLYINLYFSIPVYQPLFLCPSVSTSISRSQYINLYFSIPVCQSLFLYPSVSTSISRYQYIIINLYFSISVCQSVHIAYRLRDTVWAVNSGCFHSPSSHPVLPSNSAVNFQDEIYWPYYVERGHAGYMIQKCGLMALDKGVRYFGVEGFGICSFGDHLDTSQGQLTEKDDCVRSCYSDVGSYGYMVVYRVQTRWN